MKCYKNTMTERRDVHGHEGDGQYGRQAADVDDAAKRTLAAAAAISHGRQDQARHFLHRRDVDLLNRQENQVPSSQRAQQLHGER